MKVFSLSDVIPIGYAGENEAREIAIDICQLVRTWPDLRPELVARRPGETEVYPCKTRVEDGVLIWTVTGADTAKSGEGEARVYMLDGEGKIAKSRIVKTLIRGGMEGEMREEMPDAAAPWVDNVLDAGSKTEAAAQRAENAAQNAEGAAAAAAWDVFDANVFVVREQEEEPTYADKTHIEINLAAGDRKVILYVDGQGRPHNYMGRMPSLIDSTVMTQTFGRPVEYTDGRISWQIAQILPDGKIIKRGNAQLKAPNPYKLKLTGAVEAEYDGTKAITVNIPEGGTGGEDGGFYTPSVNADGVLSWTASKTDMPIVSSANIKGPIGPQGAPGSDGAPGAPGKDGADGFSPTVTLTREADGVVITATNKDGETSEKVYDGKDGEGGEGGVSAEPVTDEEVLEALAENDLMLAVGSDDGVLCDENGNILEW